MPFSQSSLLPLDLENPTFLIINYSDLNPIIPKTEQKLKFVNIMEEKCVMFLLWDKNVVKMDLSLKTPIVRQLDVNMILFPSQIWPGTIEKKNQSE